MPGPSSIFDMGVLNVLTFCGIRCFSEAIRFLLDSHAPPNPEFMGTVIDCQILLAALVALFGCGYMIADRDKDPELDRALKKDFLCCVGSLFFLLTLTTFLALLTLDMVLFPASFPAYLFASGWLLRR